MVVSVLLALVSFFYKAGGLETALDLGFKDSSRRIEQLSHTVNDGFKEVKQSVEKNHDRQVTVEVEVARLKALIESLNGRLTTLEEK